MKAKRMKANRKKPSPLKGVPLVHGHKLKIALGRVRSNAEAKGLSPYKVNKIVSQYRYRSRTRAGMKV